MPTLFKMTDSAEKTPEMPVVITEVAPAAAKSRSTKKYVIIAVSGILAAAIILAAILVGMYMFTEAQKEIIKYTLKMGDNSRQDVTSDPNENIVQYHVSDPSQENWIVNDFGKDLQLVKIRNDKGTNCYVSPLNRTNAMDPSKINGPESSEIKAAVSLTYRASDTPVTDTSFLGKTARALCKGISVYWLYPSCSTNKKTGNFTEMDHPKTKRQGTYDNSPYYIASYVYHQSWNGNAYWVPCVTGCCRKICSCRVDYSYSVSGNTIYCGWITYSCNEVPYSPLLDQCVDGPRGLICPNRSPASPPTC